MAGGLSTNVGRTSIVCSCSVPVTVTVNGKVEVVPYDELKFADNKVILPGGTKERLKMLPESKYATG